MKNSSNIVFLLLSAIAVAAGIYWYFFGTAGEQSIIATDPTQQNARQAEFQGLIAQLPTTFDTSIFSDPRFLALHDLTTPIAPEPQGRIDPFAPITGTRAR